jgi:predicted dehydrogenase
MDKEKDQKQPSNIAISRRDFVGGVTAAAGVMIVPRHVLGGSGFKAPSDKLNIAGVGAGGMGANNIDRCRGENIVALCDVDDERASKTYAKYPDAKHYRDFRKMLETEKGIDAVIVATPDHTHAVVAMMAIKLGKHVYVQKPMTHTVGEARKLTEAVRQYKVASQMGNQGHSGEGVRQVCEWIWGGAIGPVREVHCFTNRPVWRQPVQRPAEKADVPATLDWDLWLGPAPYRPYHPAYLPMIWRGWWDFGCGSLGDMGCHIMDAAFASLKLGYPTSVEACASTEVGDKMWEYIIPKESFPMSSVVHYSFPARGNMPPVKLHWWDGGMLPERPEELEPGRKLALKDNGGTIFVGEKGKIICGTYSDDPMLIPESKNQAYKRPAPTLPRVKGTHEQNWIDACKGGPPACSNFDYAGPFTEAVVMGNLAVRFPGQKLEWDGKNMRVTNLEEANQYIMPPYREGWSL